MGIISYWHRDKNECISVDSLLARFETKVGAEGHSWSAAEFQRGPHPPGAPRVRGIAGRGRGRRGVAGGAEQRRLPRGAPVDGASPFRYFPVAHSPLPAWRRRLAVPPNLLNLRPPSLPLPALAGRRASSTYTRRLGGQKPLRAPRRAASPGGSAAPATTTGPGTRGERTRGYGNTTQSRRRRPDDELSRGDPITWPAAIPCFPLPLA